MTVSWIRSTLIGQLTSSALGLTDMIRSCSEVDCSFFLVTVDLWSADGKHEMNLVLHPTSSDRYIPATAPKVKRKATNPSSGTTSQRSGRQSPTPSGPPSSTSQYPQVWEKSKGYPAESCTDSRCIFTSDSLTE